MNNMARLLHPQGTLSEAEHLNRASMNIYQAALLLSFSIVHNNASVTAPKCKVVIYRKASSLSLIPFVPVAPLVIRPTTTGLS